MDNPPKVRSVRVRKVKVTPVAKPTSVLKPTVKPMAAPKPVRRVKVPPKPAVRPVAVTAAPDTTTKLGLHLYPWKLDSARMFHYGNALRWFGQLGPKQVGIMPDLSVEVHTHDGRVEVIPAIVMVTRDRRYAFNFVTAKVQGSNTDGLDWEMDQYDKEFGGFTRQWKTRD